MTYRVSPMIREFVQTVDDREWQSSLFSLLQSQTYNQCEVDLFELMCKVLDQNLFSQVDWARNTIFFKDLKVSKVSLYLCSVICGVIIYESERASKRTNQTISEMIIKVLESLYTTFQVNHIRATEKLS